MVILSASRVLTQAVFTLDCSISHDQHGFPHHPIRRNLAYLSLDATGSLNADDICEAAATLVDTATEYMGRDLGFGWHDVL